MEHSHLDFPAPIESVKGTITAQFLILSLSICEIQKIELHDRMMCIFVVSDRC